MDDIDWSCPADLKPYERAYRIEQEQLDRLAHSMGMYNRYAIVSSMNKDVNYIEKPFMEIREEQREKTPEEIDEELRIELQSEIDWFDSLKEQGLPETKI